MFNLRRILRLLFVASLACWVPLSWVPCRAQPGSGDSILAVAARGDAPEVYGELTLRAALDLALQYNPGLTASAWSIRGARAARDDAGRRPNPSLGADVENFGGNLGTESIETTVAAGQVLELGGDRRARAAEADALIESATSAFDVNRLEVIAETTAGFLDVWVAQERLVRLRNAERLAEEAVAAADQRHRAGAAHSVDRLRAEGNLAVRLSERRRAEAELSAARRALAAQWGESEATYDTLRLESPDLGLPPSADSLLGQLKFHPALRQVAAEAAIAEARVLVARATRIPDLEAVLGMRRLGESNATGLVAGVSLPLPFWNTGSGAVGAAEAERSAAEARRSSVRQQLEQQLRGAYDRLSAAVESYGQVTNQLLPSSQEALVQLQAGYGAGRFSYLDYLEGQRSALEAELFALEVAKDVWSARMTLARLTGQALETAARSQEER